MSEPEVYWCPLCGKNVWAIPGPTFTVEKLICDACRDKHKKDMEAIEWPTHSKTNLKK